MSVTVTCASCTSTVSEQYSKKIPGQFLEGGGKQAVIDPSSKIMTEAAAAADVLYAKGGGKATLSNGVTIEVKQTGWTAKNGTEGYADIIIPGAAMTERLGVTEFQTKVATATTSGAGKDQRAATNRNNGKP